VSFLAMLFASFQPHEYARAAVEPSGGFRFLAKWLAIVSLATAFAMSQLLGAMGREISSHLQTTADFRLQEGRFQFDGPQPHRAELPGGFVAVVDTTGKTRIDALPVAGPALLVASDRLTLRSAAGERELKFTELGPVTLTRADLLQSMETLPIAGFFLYAGLYLWWLALAWLFTGFGGSVVVMATEGRLSPRAGSRLAAHAFAIPMAVGASPLSFPGLWLAVALTGAVLTWLGAKAALAAATPRTSL
jgi:hypothetical protein